MRRTSGVLAGLIGLSLASVASAQTTRPALTWDRTTLRWAANGSYARMARLKNGEVILTYERRGRSYVQHSADHGLNWGDPVMAAEVAFGSASNPQPLVLADGTVWLLYNERPRDGKHPYTIRLTTSTDNGRTWTPRQEPLYSAGEKWGDGCWEPAAVQLASGEILLVFANEGPYRTSDEQEITLLRSTDAGRTWTTPHAVSFRRGHRDGMPVPLVLSDGGVVVAVEDNGLTGNGSFKPTIFRIEGDNFPIGGGDPRRWPAEDVPGRKGVFASAPYLCQMPGGQTVLSCQGGKEGEAPRMVVYVGDAEAKHFGGESAPFPTDAGKSGLWNSLFLKDATTVTAISATTINGRFGVWLIDGTFR